MRSSLSSTGRAACVICGMLIPALAGSAAPSAPGDTVQVAAPRLALSFQLGIDLYQPGASILKLDELIKSSGAPLPSLARMADSTRSENAASFHDAERILKALGAPPNVIRPYQDAADAFARPLTISESAKQQVPNDALGQDVWSVLDEADQSMPQDGGATSAWLKLAHGRDALWAFHLGNLVAVARAGIPGKHPDLPLVSGAEGLAKAAPTGTPASLIAALTSLGDKAKHKRVDVSSLATLDSAASAVFTIAAQH